MKAAQATPTSTLLQPAADARAASLPLRERRARRASPITLALIVAFAAGMAVASVRAASVTDRGRQKQAAESERANLRKQLDGLKRDMGRTEAARTHAADALARSETAISNANRKLHELATEQEQVSARLEGLSQRQGVLRKSTDARQSQLARMLREQYLHGDEQRLQLLLSGDNPNRIARELQYMSYVSQAQARLVESLRRDLQEVERNQAATQEARSQLDEIAGEQKQQKQVLEDEKARRADMLAQLSGKLAAQRKEAGNLQRDEQRLSSLVDQLAKMLEQQRRQALAEAERRRQEAALRQKKQAARDARAARARPQRQARQASRPNPDAIDADENPARSRNGDEPNQGTTVQTDSAGSIPGPAFASLRGHLPLPLRGELVARYGTKRTDGPAWKGLFIRAPEGADVKSVAAGRIVFAEWLRGFGNLIIVDHGAEYMTIYGNNQAILKHAGDMVHAGETIARAGNSGGNEQSGLYFEVRFQGRAVDPMRWVAAR